LAVAVEIFRRPDLSVFQRICWLLAILIVPLLGAITYLIVSWRTVGRKEVSADLPRSAPAEPTNVSDLTELDRLRRSGVLTDAEFEAGRQRILEGRSGRHAAEEVGS
jgi:hypothetical protein